MMMVMVMVTMMVNVCDDDCYLMVMKVILVKEVMSCDVSPVAMFFHKKWVFTGASGSELATIFSSAASKTSTFTLRHSKKAGAPYVHLGSRWLPKASHCVTSSEKGPTVCFGSGGPK